MKHLAAGFFVRYPLRLSEQESLITLAENAAASSGTAQKNYLYQMLGILTGQKIGWHNFTPELLNRALELAGMTKKAHDGRTSADAKQKLHEVVDYISSKTGKSHYEILENNDSETIIRALYALQLEETRASLQRMAEQHGATGPKGKPGYFDSQKQRLERLEEKVDTLLRKKIIRKPKGILSLIKTAGAGHYV